MISVMNVFCCMFFSCVEIEIHFEPFDLQVKCHTHAKFAQKPLRSNNHITSICFIIRMRRSTCAQFVAEHSKNYRHCIIMSASTVAKNHSNAKHAVCMDKILFVLIFFNLLVWLIIIFSLSYPEFHSDMCVCVWRYLYGINEQINASASVSHIWCIDEFMWV